MSKIAVIGSNGFIGSNLCKELKYAGHKVIKADLPKFDVTDIDTFDILNNPDVIYHLATMTLNNCNKYYNNCIETNITGTANVMHYAKSHNVKRVIYASASSVYGTPIKLPASENDFTEPLTIYGMTKLAGESIVRILSNDFDLIGVMFRFTNVYGPGQQNGLIPTVINNIINNEEIKITGDGKQTRDFVYIKDIVTILKRAIEIPNYRFIANLGSGKQTSINEIVKLCSNYMKADPSINYIPEINDREDFRASLDRFKRVYGNYQFVNINDGIANTINWWIHERNAKET